MAKRQLRPVDAQTAQRLNNEHRAEVTDAVLKLESVRARKAAVDQQLVIVRSDLLRLKNQDGWHAWLVWPVLAIGTAMEWNIASVVAQTVFGQSFLGMTVFTAALAIGGVTLGWFLGRVLREGRMAGAQPAASTGRFAAATFLIIAMLLAAGFVLRFQAARTLLPNADLMVLIGQATITTVLSALGVLVAAGIEFFREGDKRVATVRTQRQLENDRDFLTRLIVGGEALYHRTVRAYGLVLAEIGVSIDPAFLATVEERAAIVNPLLEDADAEPAADEPGPARRKTIEVIRGEFTTRDGQTPPAAPAPVTPGGGEPNDPPSGPIGGPAPAAPTPPGPGTPPPQPPAQ